MMKSRYYYICDECKNEIKSRVLQISGVGRDCYGVVFTVSEEDKSPEEQTLFDEDQHFCSKKCILSFLERKLDTSKESNYESDSRRYPFSSHVA
jgi:hypothetical protein